MGIEAYEMHIYIERLASEGHVHHKGKFELDVTTYWRPMQLH